MSTHRLQIACTSPLAAILADPAARARWISWRVALHAARQRNAARAAFRSSRGAA